MTWTLYSSPRSPFVRKVMIAAHDLGLADRITCRDVVTNPMAPAPDLDGVNPMGMIPTLDTGAEVVFDSLVILDLLDEVAQGSLFGTGAARRAVLVRHAMINAAMDKAVRILDERFRVQNDDTQAHRAGYVAAILKTLAWVEPHLGDDRFDAGDIALAALLTYMDARYRDIDWATQAPKARAWLDVVVTRPSMTATGYAVPAPA